MSLPSGFKLVLPPEYEEVLDAVIGALLKATADRRLPALTSDQVHYWLGNLRVEDVDRALQRYLQRRAA